MLEATTFKLKSCEDNLQQCVFFWYVVLTILSIKIYFNYIHFNSEISAKVHYFYYLQVLGLAVAAVYAAEIR